MLLQAEVRRISKACVLCPNIDRNGVGLGAVCQNSLQAVCPYGQHAIARLPSKWKTALQVKVYLLLESTSATKGKERSNWGAARGVGVGILNEPILLGRWAGMSLLCWDPVA